MNKFYDEVKSKALASYRALAKDYAPFDDANMLLGAAEKNVALSGSKVTKTIDTEWITKIEEAIPALDTVVRNAMVAIEDVDEVLPVELSKHITEKSIKHLAQHTNYILDIKEDGEVVPQKILNVFHEETYLTYENKFVNTLLSRLSAFVDKRLRALGGANGVEMNYKFGFSTEFEHLIADDGGRNLARINLQIELTSPLGPGISESDFDINKRYGEALARLKRIHQALISYRSSAFSERLGKNFIRPPVIRTNAILKNKNLKELLNLWEYIEGYDKVGYSFIADTYYELPSEEFVGGMYSSAALQYLQLYSGIADGVSDNRLISEKHLFETMPEFDDEVLNDDIEDYQVYDAEYRKTVPVSRLMNNRKKLSEDEKRIREALLLALKADEMIEEALLREEAEKRRIAEEQRRAEEEAKRLAAEEEAAIAAIAAQGVEAVDQLIDAELSMEADASRMESGLNDMIRSAICGKRSTSFSSLNATPLLRGKSAGLRITFAFKGGDEIGASFVIPYTRKEYLDMPRKKKKSVLTSIRVLLVYASTARLVHALEKLGSSNERINERIGKLRDRLREERKALPSAPLWAEAVQRVVR